MSSQSTGSTKADQPVANAVGRKLYDEFSAGPPIEGMAQMKTHNHLLGNRAALDEAWKKDGYWFFRDVLDTGAVGRLRERYVKDLERQGLVDQRDGAITDTQVRYNGADLSEFNPSMDEIQQTKAWRSFVDEKPIHDFFASVLDDDPFWFPSVAYRVVPPMPESGGSARYAGIHADSTSNPGVAFKTCWFPLVEIDERTGGLILAEGVTEQIRKRNPRPIINDSYAFLAVDEIPPNAWRRTNFNPGDVLMMNCFTPHCGVSNLSDRFRLSLDVRIVGASQHNLAVGPIAAISPDSITVSEPAGDVTLKIDEYTYVRTRGDRLTGEAIMGFYKPGMEVIVGRDGDTATFVRL